MFDWIILFLLVVIAGGGLILYLLFGEDRSVHPDDR